MSGAIRPVYASRIENSTVPLAPGFNSNVRVPVNNPSGIPPIQTILRHISHSLTFTGKARPGLIFACTVMRSPGAMVPSTRSTVWSQPG